MKKILATLALVLMTGSASAGMIGPPIPYDFDKGPTFGMKVRPDKKNTVVITNNRGGSIGNFWRHRDYMEGDGTKIEIKGECFSACVVYLGAPGACVHHGALIEFHQGSDDIGTEMMLDETDPHLRSWVLGHFSKLPAYDAGTFLVLRADEAIDNGWLKACQPLPKNFDATSGYPTE